jgi:hypothetical protein
MVDPIDNIAYQARQGSVAAIIQILNEKLADDGVRVRAVFADNKLQLLCEAATAEQLEQRVLVDRIRGMLEAIAPRNIRRVHMHSRLVEEQQLLWFDEIRREPDQLLWSEEIRLRLPNPIQRWVQDISRDRPARAALPKTARQTVQGQQFWRGIIGGIGLSILLLLAGWAIAKSLGWVGGNGIPIGGSDPPGEEPPSSDPTPTSDPEPTPELPTPSFDPFAQAVTIAQQAAEDGSEADSAAEWLELAARWQRAADLMAQVGPDDPRFETAQGRVQLYQENSQAALTRAGTP